MGNLQNGGLAGEAADERGREAVQGDHQGTGLAREADVFGQQLEQFGLRFLGQFDIAPLIQIADAVIDQRAQRFN